MYYISYFYETLFCTLHPFNEIFFIVFIYSRKSEEDYRIFIRYSETYVIFRIKSINIDSFTQQYINLFRVLKFLLNKFTIYVYI